MAKKTKNLQLSISRETGTFSTWFKRLSGSKDEYDFNSLAALRNILSNEKARMLHVIKTKKPGSIYALARILKRDFKSVMADIKLLEQFGCIDLLAEKTGKRVRHKPVVIIDALTIEIQI